MSVLKKAAKYFAIALVWLAAWWGASILVGNSIIFPAPSEVVLKLLELIKIPTFWLSILYSLARILFGLFTAMIAAIILASLSFRFSLIKDFLKPALSIIKSTPVVSFVFIAFVAFSQNLNALAAFISALIVFPVIYESILDSLLSTPQELIEVSDVFGCSFYERLRYLWVPSALPRFITSSKTAIGLAWKAGVAAEALVAIPTMLSIGNEIADAKTWLETTEQFAWTLVIIILSLTIELIFSLIAKKLTDKIL